VKDDIIWRVLDSLISSNVQWRKLQPSEVQNGDGVGFHGPLRDCKWFERVSFEHCPTKSQERVWEAC